MTAGALCIGGIKAYICYNDMMIEEHHRILTTLHIKVLRMYKFAFYHNNIENDIKYPFLRREQADVNQILRVLKMAPLSGPEVKHREIFE